MAKPISATPILTGKDLLRLIADVQRPDNAKEIRAKSISLLDKALAKGSQYEAKKRFQ